MLQRLLLINYSINRIFGTKQILNQLIKLKIKMGQGLRKDFGFDICPDGAKIRKEKIKLLLKLELNPAEFRLKELTLYW